MNKNYEIKCELTDRKTIAHIIYSVKGYSHSVEKQTDVYYKADSGRLKLRIINDRLGNLIFYDRGEKTGMKISKYIISQTKDHKELNSILRKQFKVLVIVNKKRDIYIHNNIRVHIDTVKGLGRFLEIEIIYENLSKAKEQMKGLISKFQLNENKFIKGSYSDLLINLR